MISFFKSICFFLFTTLLSISFCTYADTGKEKLSLPIDPSVIWDHLKEGQNVKNKVSDRIEAMRYAAKFPYQDVVDALGISIANEVDFFLKTPYQNQIQKDHHFDFILHMIKALGEVATHSNWLIIEEQIRQTYKIDEQLSDIQLEDLSQAIAKASQLIQAREELLPQLPKVTHRDLSTGTSIKEKLNNFKNVLEELIKGQPHVIEMLVKLRMRDFFFGYRENPAFIWFLGPPGTGKDTAVKAYLTGVHGHKDAHITHMHRVDPLRSQGDLWSFLGSGTGYVGSENFPEILNFLIQHSGGRYLKDEVKNPTGKVSYRIIENPAWKTGDVLPGYSSPERGVVYLDEFHDWSMSLKNAIVKKAAEYGGYWKVNNQNGGLGQIYVPINIIAASNDGMELVTSREKNGERFGKPLSYEQMMQKFESVKTDYVALRNSIKKGARLTGGQDAKGTSEELLNRVPDDYLVLFGPVSPEQLKTIAKIKLNELNDRIQKSKSGFDKIKITWSPNVINFIQEYNYVAEDQARPIESKVRSLIEATIIQAVNDEKLKPNEKINLKIDIEQKKDGTWQLIFTDQLNKNNKSFSLDITSTYAERLREPITDEQIDELIKIPEQLKSRIIGQGHVLDKVAESILLSQDGRKSVHLSNEATMPARTFMFLGPTSTGKTETAKQIAEIMYDSRHSAVTIDATSLQTIQKMHEKIFGYKDSNGDPVPSDFMKHYDRNNGRFVLVMDELANVQDKNVLNALFDLLREPVVTTFCDGVERVMSNVIIIITGNASQEILAELPQNLPEAVIREAWDNIYEQLEFDPHLRRSVLENYFTPPLLARIGDDKTFFYKPLSYSDVRKLTQLKFESALKDLAGKNGQRGWNLKVASRADYLNIIEALETHGFKLKEQGASIDGYVKKVFADKLKSTLLLAKVKNNETVEVRLLYIDEAKSDHTLGHNKLTFALKSESGKEFTFEIDGRPIRHNSKVLKQDMIMTAGHEAGHAIAGMVLLNDFFVPTLVKILPGITRIADRWVHYAGLASQLEKIKPEITRQFLVRRIAVLMAGTVAENLIVDGGIDTAGRSNDMERATEIAKKAVLEFGMSDYFGRSRLTEAELSEQDKVRLRNEVDVLIREGELLAYKALVANKDTFVALTNELAEKGELDNSSIMKVIEKNGITLETDRNFNKQTKKNASFFNRKGMLSQAKWIEQFAGFVTSQFIEARSSGVRYKFVSKLNLISEDQVVDLEKLLELKKREQLKSVNLYANASIANQFGPFASCKSLFP